METVEPSLIPIILVGFAFSWAAGFSSGWKFQLKADADHSLAEKPNDEWRTAAAWDAAWDAARASSEIQAMDILEKDGRQPYFLAFFGFDTWDKIRALQAHQ